MNDKLNLEMTFELSHPPEKVWRALTEPALLARWLLKTNLIPEVGTSFHFQRDPLPGWDGRIDCEVLQADAPRSISYTWRALGVDTVVTWTLEPIPTGTRLQLVQAGFEPTNKQAYYGARGGWQAMVGVGLTEVLARLVEDNSLPGDQQQEKLS